MGWGDTRPTPATTEAYRESKYWDNVEKAKKDKEECKKKESSKNSSK